MRDDGQRAQFLFPGLYLKHLFWRLGPLHQDLATEVYVLLKAAFPIMMGSCAFLMPIAGARFIRSGAYDARAALGLDPGAPIAS